MVSHINVGVEKHTPNCLKEEGKKAGNTHCHIESKGELLLLLSYGRKEHLE